MQTLKELLDDKNLTEIEQFFFIDNNVDIKLAEKMLCGDLELECAMSFVKEINFDYKDYDNYEYIGEYAILEDFADELVNDGYFGHIDDSLRYYIDLELLVKHLLHDYFIIDYKYLFKIL